jgi:hypothetical protein
MAAPASAEFSSGIPPLPAGVDLAQLAEKWQEEEGWLDYWTHCRVMNAALGLSDWADAGERSAVVHGRRWAPDELCARFELARRNLGPPSGRRPIPQLPADADLAQLAEQWGVESILLGSEAHDRVMNAALGLPEDAHQGDRSGLVHGRRWAPDELRARFELARRELGITASLPRQPGWWSPWRYRWGRQLRTRWLLRGRWSPEGELKARHRAGR